MVLSGKGKASDSEVLRLLLTKGPMTISQMAHSGGTRQDADETKTRATIYRRCIFGRNDSNDRGLLDIGYIERMRTAESVEVFNITERGARELAKVDLTNHLDSLARMLADQEPFGRIVNVCLRTRTDPLTLFRACFRDSKELEDFADMAEWAEKEFK
jgi:hypothetical protein